MTEKKFFVYKPFLSLNISYFSLFFYVKIVPPEKVTTFFTSNPSENLDLV